MRICRGGIEYNRSSVPESPLQVMPGGDKPNGTRCHFGFLTTEDPETFEPATFAIPPRTGRLSRVTTTGAPTRPALINRRRSASGGSADDDGALGIRATVPLLEFELRSPIAMSPEQPDLTVQSRLRPGFLLCRES